MSGIIRLGLARAPKMWKMSLPPDVVVSICSDAPSSGKRYADRPVIGSLCVPDVVARFATEA